MTDQGNPQASPDWPDAAEVDQLRRTAENPLARPSERVEARRKLVELGEVRARRISGKDRTYALIEAREMLRKMDFE